MTHRSPGSRTLKVDTLTRVEGEGGLAIQIDGDAVTGAQLHIYEPPRFFEAFLRGRSYTEPPDITARICGICPVAYQMSACLAIEDACGVVVDGPLHDLRKLLYAGEWIESHALHVYLLHLPDFLGYPSAIELAQDHRAIVEQGLQLKKTGNKIIEFLAGRAIHPVNVRVGGFYRVPERTELATLAPDLEHALELALATVRLVGNLDIPDFGHDHPYVALRRSDEYAVLGGRLVSTTGLDVPIADFSRHFSEEQVEWSTALHAHLLGGDHYLVGPLARFALNADRLAPQAQAIAREVGLDAPCRNPFRSIVVRAVEIVHAIEEAQAVLDRYERPDTPHVPVEPRAAIGHGATEAPRGTLYHRYELAADGTILDAVIIPPTAQNQATIEHDVFAYAASRSRLSDDELTAQCEQLVRSYDPCISCAAHFLDVRIDRINQQGDMT
ncbi:MAG: Ni/Fe hydrogenase subunit alpha [Acidimicrobiales bacterium]|nr:Ni/Fe hydrogenase subunit alpha [Acidimicrobiales bacterium]